jgi:hypothetical protein
VRRLIGEGEAYDEADAVVAALLEETGVTPEQAAAADAVTNVCDVISFLFCFEEPAERELRGYRVAVDGEGGFEVDPWPFDAAVLAGHVTAYAADGYPDARVPVVVPFLSKS